MGILSKITTLIGHTDEPPVWGQQAAKPMSDGALYAEPPIDLGAVDLCGINGVDVQLSDGWTATDGDLCGTEMMLRFADGAQHRVRVMLLLRHPDDGVVIVAHCFEVAETRYFPVSAIDAVVEKTGEAASAPEFLRNALQVDLETGDKAGAGVEARRRFADGWRILAAIAHADGFMDDREVDVITDYLGSECELLRMAWGEEDDAAMFAFIRRQRPGAALLGHCLAGLEEAGEEACERLVEFAYDLMESDGVVDETEAALLDEIEAALDAAMMAAEDGDDDLLDEGDELAEPRAE